MSNRFNFFFTEALRSLTTNIATTVSATVTMLLALLLVGGFLIVLLAVQGQADQIQHDASRVKVFLNASVTEDQTNNLRERLEGMSDVSSVQYISKKAALVRAKKLFKEDPETLEQLPYNPFPASLEAKLKNPTQVKIVAGKMENEDGVQKVTYGGKTSERIIHVINILKYFVVTIALLLIAAATVLIANAIRLSIFSRRREIEVMKLVGASNMFVRFPFMLEGLICGMFAAICAVFMIWVTQLLLRDVDFISGLHADHNSQVFLGLIILGVFLGGMSSAMTIRRYLRI